MQNIKFTKLLDSIKPTQFLVDASGVIYTDTGPIPMIADAFLRMQSLGPVFVVTNNSNHNVPLIKDYLADMGISIALDHIISSGWGLQHDPLLRSMINKKNVFVFGNESSYPYVNLANPEKIVPDLADADVVVITSSLKHDHQKALDELVSYFLSHPNTPLICTNPDLYVNGVDGLIPVAGYAAKEVESRAKVPVHWFGKPYNNFSYLVDRLVSNTGLNIDKKTVFFDDNPFNVQTMQRELGLTGCCIAETGLYSEFKLQAKEVNVVFDYLVPDLTPN